MTLSIFRAKVSTLKSSFEIGCGVVLTTTRPEVHNNLISLFVPLPVELRYFTMLPSMLTRQALNKSALCFGRQFSSSSDKARNVVVVGGIRIPFAQTSTIYQDEMAVDLQRLAITGLLTQTAVPKDAIDYVICGNVIQEVRTSNIAREAAVNAGLPYHISAHTVAQACISANAAIVTGAQQIMTGHSHVVLAGGCETFSDVPIRLTRPIRQKLITMNKAMKKGGPLGAVRHMLKGLKTKDLALETPAIANYTTGEVMGVSSDKLSAKFGVSRQEQDDFTVRSHTLAQKAHDAGFYKEEIIPYKGSTIENGIKGDSTVESVGKLKPAFIKPHGTHTAANSSYLTDGAAMSLLMSEEKALEMGFKPWAYIRDWSFRSCDPWEELLLGPTYCTHDILQRNKLSLSEVGVLEIHEGIYIKSTSSFEDHIALTSYLTRRLFSISFCRSGFVQLGCNEQ